MRLRAAALALCIAGPACADVDAALEERILPGFAAFSKAATDLESAAESDCRSETLRPTFHAAFDVWMAVADLRLGPSESGALSVAFWPDDRGATRRALSRLVAGENPVAHDPDGYADVSVAARGLFALEMLLHDPRFESYETGSYTCVLVRTVAADLAQQGAALDAAWTEEFANTIRTAGEPHNAIYLSGDEAVRAIYTQILSGLEFTAEIRLGRPIGTFDRPRPRRAEAWRSERSLRNATLAVDAAHALAHALADTELPETDAAADRVRKAVDRILDPGFQDVTDPQARLRVEVLQQAVRAMSAAIEAEIGARLGIAPGFNSQDGD